MIKKEIRELALKRVNLVIEKQDEIDNNLDSVMEGWRLKRLPRIDRDILRLALVDLIDFNTPIAVTCNEAVNLANRYSDEQGRRMINGVLRKLQNSNFNTKFEMKDDFSQDEKNSSNIKESENFFIC